MTLIPPNFLDCVVAIGAPEDDTTNWVASGFFYGVPSATEADTYHTYLVTNRHVIDAFRRDGLERVSIRVNPRAQDQQPHEFFASMADDQGDPLWHGHPDEDIDVAVSRVNMQLLIVEREMQVSWFQSDQHARRVSEMQSLGVTEGDGVFVLGFPMGLVGRERSVVIVRSGSIARIRDMLAGTESSFLLDATVFPGNSGGPVVFRPEILSIEGTAPAIGHAFLLGVVSSYVPYEDVAVSPQTGRPRIVFEENTGLSAVFPVDYIDETIADWDGALVGPTESVETAAEGP